MLGIGVVALAGFGAAAGAAANFEKQIDQFGAITGATGEALQGVSDKALQLGQDTIFSAGQVAGAIAELAKAGINTKDIMDGAADAVVHLAAATDTDLTTSAEIAANAMNTFNLTGAEMNGIVDAIAKAANASTISVQDIGTSLKYAGGPAHALGISIEETTAAIGLLGKAGITGSTAGTSLRRIFLNLTPASKEAAAEMEKLGIITKDGSNQFYDAAGNAKSLRDIMGILNTATKNLSAEQKVQALNTIFGNRAVSSAILLADQGAAGYDEFTASLAALPSAADISAKRLDNLSGDIEILKGNVETTLVKAGTPFQEMLRGWVQGLTRLLQAFSDLSPSTQKLILQILLYGGAIFAAIGATSLLLGMLINFAQRVYQIVKAIEFLLKVTKVWGLLAKAMAPLRFIIAGIRTAMLGLNAALLANPIGLVVLAIIALAAIFYLAYKYIKPFHEGVDILWQALQRAWDVVLGFAKGIGTDLVVGFNVAKDAVTRFVGSIVGFVTGIPTAIGNAIDSVGNFLSRLPGMAATAFMNFVNAAATFLANLPMQIAYWLGFAIGAFIKLNIDAAVQAVQFGIMVIGAIIGFVAAMPGAIAGFLTDAYNWFLGFVTNLIAQAIIIGIQVVDAIIGFFTRLPGQISDAVTSAYNAFINFVPRFIAGAQDLGSRVLNGIVGFFTQLPGRIANFMTDMVTSITNAATSAYNGAVNFGQKMLDGINTFVTSLPGAVANIVQRMIDTITGAVTQAYNAVKDLGGNMWKGFKDGMGIKSPSFIEKATTALISNVADDIDTLKDHVKTLQGLGVALPDVASQMDVNLTASGANSAPSGDGGTTIQMEFNGVTAADAQVLKSTLGSTAVLTRITQAAKAGRKS